MVADLHNHVIPGVDDGARSPSEAVAALEALTAQGVTEVVATPHVDGSLTHRPAALADRLDALDEGWSRLTRAVEGRPGPRLGRGVELKLDLPEVDLSDPRLRLDSGATVLVEFPFMAVPPRSADVLVTIRSAGYQPLLAHPERYYGGAEWERGVRSWLDAGAVLQVNAGSLTGSYGPTAMERARWLVGRGWAHCLASDYHARGVPDVAVARGLLAEWGAEEQARLLFEENPRRLLRGEAPLPVSPALARETGLRGLLRMMPWAG